MNQETAEWQWYQLNHIQIICTTLQTDNNANTSSLNFYTPNAGYWLKFYVLSTQNRSFRRRSPQFSQLGQLSNSS